MNAQELIGKDICWGATITTYQHFWLSMFPLMPLSSVWGMKALGEAMNSDCVTW